MHAKNIAFTINDLFNDPLFKIFCKHISTINYLDTSYEPATTKYP